MRILVIGGSYFFGRWFVQIAHKEHEITVLNRGTLKIGLEGVGELRCDRHDEEALSLLGLSSQPYDVAVDFCAYDKGDIDGILKHLDTESLKKYVFISTVDVYRHTQGGNKDEDSPLEDITGQDPVGSYIGGKVRLEKELKQAAGRYGIKPVSVRPAVLYGPLNYAPRESVYFEWIEKAGQIIHPVDANGFWQMIYVEDAVRALLRICSLSEDETLDAYNFCTDELTGYDSLKDALYEVFGSFEKIEVTVEDVIEKNIPLPFPLRAEESFMYSPDRFLHLIEGYTPLAEGLRKSAQKH